MPFTPFHLGPALLFGLLAYRWLDLPTVLAASVLVDVRATLVFFGLLDGRLHGPLHTLLGSAVVAALVAGGWYAVRPWFDPLLDALRIAQPRSPAAMVAGALASAWLHVALDAVLYTDVQPFAPLADWNPLYGVVGFLAVYPGCVVAGALGCVGYGLWVLETDSTAETRSS